ncbi:zf-TFIIB domain-containing protein [Cohnella soli]|uniref:Zf-TFIIB domain-containing protein n=1 Tax=Cohnella soli TaxID=425005 RepID=A0ABW0HNC9_9BACL
MNCPVCENSRMREVEKNGIMIDVCPSCKGVWLDRGELDKLMQDVREVKQEYNEWYYGDPRNAQEPQRQQYSQPPQQSYPQQQQGHGHGHSSYPPYKKKKKSVMDVFGDLFD